MGTEIEETDRQAGSLTLAQSELELLSTTTDEANLTDEQFALVCRIANAPAPIPASADDDDVRKVIGALASTLKSARTSTEQGRLQLGLYRKVLVGVPKAALSYAGDRAIADLEWMPTPSELKRLCNRWSNPQRQLQTRAQYLARTRSQRLFQERCRLLEKREFPPDQFGTLTEQEIAHGVMRKGILQELDGTIIPWTSSDEQRIFTERREALGLTDERDNRAIEGEKAD